MSKLCQYGVMGNVTIYALAAAGTVGLIGCAGAYFIGPREKEPCAMYELYGEHQIKLLPGPAGLMSQSDFSCPSAVRWKVP